jgi:2-oxoglutarate dehydrogenase E2 component (dihydrolipoamide succinyltransferase)
MSIEVKIPAVGESISSGVVSVWHKKNGERVEKGDTLLTLETDKVSTEIAAEGAGVLQTRVAEGTEVKIGEVVATIDESATGGAATSTHEKAKPDPNTSGAQESSGDGKTSDALSPAVRRIVDEEQLDPSKIRGSGKGGRLTKGDALEAAKNKTAAPAPQAQPQPERKEAKPEQPVASDGGRITRRKMSPLRRKIAAQLVMAQHTAAILTTFNEVDMTEVMALRAKSQDAFTKKNKLKLGFMSFFIKATVQALKGVPSINSRIEGDDFIQNNFYDIGVAVGTERGLVVPIVRDADKKSFAELEKDIADYAIKARDGKIKIEDLQGGTFTISNGGVYGSLLSTPILNPPQSGILGMHKIMDRAVVIEGKVVPRPMMFLALSYDHRAVDGKEAVTFLVKVKEGIENPKTLPLDF